MLSIWISIRLNAAQLVCVQPHRSCCPLLCSQFSPGRHFGPRPSIQKMMWNSRVLFRTPCKHTRWGHSMLRGWRSNSPSKTLPRGILVNTAAWCLLPNARKLARQTSAEITKYFCKLMVALVVVVQCQPFEFQHYFLWQNLLWSIPEMLLDGQSLKCAMLIVMLSVGRLLH